MKEPLIDIPEQKTISLSEYWNHLLIAGKHLKVLIIAQLLTGFNFMALPFYLEGWITASSTREILKVLWKKCW